MSLRQGRARLYALVLVVGASLSSACFTLEEGRDLRSRVDTLDGRVRDVERGVGDEVERAHTKVAELEEVLERATAVVTRSSADTGAQVEVLQQQIAVQEGAIDELRHELSRVQEEFREQQRDYEDRMKKLAQRAGVDMTVDDADIPTGRDEHYQAALRADETREYSRARALYRAYITRYAEDARADDAQYRVGHSYLQEDRPATALGELRRVITVYSSGDQVSDALLAMAEAFYRLHACTEARSSIEAFLARDRRHPRAAEARRRLTEIQHAPTGYCRQ